MAIPAERSAATRRASRTTPWGPVSATPGRCRAGSPLRACGSGAGAV